MIWPGILESNLEVNSITHISLLKEVITDVSHYLDSHKEQNEKFVCTTIQKPKVIEVEARFANTC